ncbi:ABC transporter substrate-binding protein [Bradyrhizobium icense]|uniref:Sugar ABC transporter substrate-binding protein n=1 Tax=Bradyrhizobium icense TaxID=1274631 RepID=A0A1B1UA33_9BRAD|nr:extracellular solute-binding protein [Bradyrhizobium icense]ANV99638.1 sugar ABC transporter substrate-binding protein [Bradyrhizobium icense]
MESQKPHRGLSRRDAIMTATAAGVAASIGPFFHVTPARAAKTLKILQWSHFVPGYDRWFNNTYTKEWGKKNDTEVIVDNINLALLESRAAAEVSAQKGHDLFMLLMPPSVFEDQVVPMNDVYAECEKASGKAIELGIKSTYNPKTKQYFAFSDSYVPDPVNYRTDLWGDIGMKPDTWDDIRVGGKKIKDKTRIPVGIGLSAEIDTGVAMRAIMYSFGAHEQDEAGNLTINSKNTLEALRFVKGLFEDCMTAEVLAWDASSNNRQMLAGRSSLVLNAISVTRTGENQKMAIHEKIAVAKAAKGPVRRMGLEHVMDCYVIWKFAENIPGAQKFLVDYIANFKEAFLASEFYNFPCFPQTVPDLKQLISHDKKAVPPDKYAVLEDVLDWATNIGYPGYSTAPISDTYQTWLLNTAFAEAATGAETPEDALKKLDTKMKAIWAKWKERGMI